MDPEISAAVIGASSAIVAALGAQVVGGTVTAGREERRMAREQKRWEAEQSTARLLRNLEDRKLIVEDILAGIADLTEYYNDHFQGGVPDRFVDKVELQEMLRTPKRANRRGRLYFSHETIELVVEELRYWEKLIGLLDKPELEQRRASFRLMADRSKSGRQEELEAALKREVGQVDT